VRRVNDVGHLDELTVMVLSSNATDEALAAPVPHTYVHRFISASPPSVIRTVVSRHARSPTNAGVPILLLQSGTSWTPPHSFHVERAEEYAKSWLEPIELAESRGFRSHELTALRRMIEEHRDKFIIAWNEHMGR